MKSNILENMLFLTISGSLIAVLLYSISPITKRCFSKTWNYFIWLLVLVKLLIPIASPINITTLLSDNIFLENIKEESVQKKSQMNYNIEMPYYGVQTVNSEAESHQQDLSSTLTLEGQETQIIDGNSEFLEKSKITISPTDIIFYLWLSLSLFFLIKKIVNYIGFVHLIQKDIIEVQDQKILDLYNRLSRTLTTRKTPLLYQSNRIHTPMIIGHKKARIILPNNPIDLERLEYIFLHELTHHNRHDILYKWLMEITICIHWFNPIVYLVRKNLNGLCDLSCDEKVILNLTAKEQRIYGDTLLHSLESRMNPTSNVATLTLSSNSKLMKERLIAIMKYKKKTKKNKYIALLLAGILFVLTVSIGIYSNHAQANTADKININSNFGTDVNDSSTVYSYKDTLHTMPPLSGIALHTASYEGTWAQATGIEGANYLEQLQQKQDYIEDVYDEKQERFLIFETIPEEEMQGMQGMDGMRYLWEESSVYRELTTVTDSLFLCTKESSFSASGGNEREYMRNVFYIEEDSELTLNMDWELSEGKMGLYLVSPQGRCIYRKVPTDTYTDTIIVGVEQGLWSIILVNEYENGHMKGEKGISGNVKKVSRFFSDVWIEEEFVNASNIILEFPALYTQDIWDVTFIWGDYDTIALNYNDLKNRKMMLGVGHDVDYGLVIGLPGNETLTIDLRELEETLKMYEAMNERSKNKAVQKSLYAYYTQERADEDALRWVNITGTWGEYIEGIIPYMSQEGVEELVFSYLKWHLSPGITSSNEAMNVGLTIDTAFKYLSNEAQQEVEKTITEFY